MDHINELRHLRDYLLVINSGTFLKEYTTKQATSLYHYVLSETTSQSGEILFMLYRFVKTQARPWEKDMDQPIQVLLGKSL